MNFALPLIQEAFLDTLWPPTREITGDAMAAFGTYPMLPATAFATLGTLGAVILLWLVGYGLYRLVGPFDRIERRTPWMHHKGFFMLALISAPFGFMLAFSSGIFRTPLPKALLITTAGASAFYGYHWL